MDEARGALMGREEIRQILAGAAASIAVLALLFFAYKANRESARIPAAGYRIDALFNRVGGIGPGTPVEVAGIPVGAIETISLLPDYRARVSMRIDTGIALPRDTSAAIHTDGLFGGKFLVLEPGGEDATLGDGGTIAYTQDAVVISELLDLIIAEGRAARAAEPDKGA